MKRKKGLCTEQDVGSIVMQYLIRTNIFQAEELPLTETIYLWEHREGINPSPLASGYQDVPNISGCVQSWKHRARNYFKKAFSSHPLHPEVLKWAVSGAAPAWKSICQMLQRSKLALYPQILKEQEQPVALLQQPARQESNLSWIPGGQGECWAFLGGDCYWRELFTPQTGPKTVIYEKNPNQTAQTNPL